MRCQWLQASFTALDDNVWAEFGPWHDDFASAADWLEQQDLLAGYKYRLALEPVGTVVRLVGLDSLRATTATRAVVQVAQSSAPESATTTTTAPVLESDPPREVSIAEIERDPVWDRVLEALICTDRGMRIMQIAAKLHLPPKDVREALDRNARMVTMLPAGWIVLKSREAELVRPKVIDIQPVESFEPARKKAGVVLQELLIERYPGTVTPADVIAMGYAREVVVKAFENARSRHIAEREPGRVSDDTKHRAVASWLATRREPNAPEDS